MASQQPPWILWYLPGRPEVYPSGRPLYARIFIYSRNRPTDLQKWIETKSRMRQSLVN